MTNKIILVCGVQATGKSWLCRQLTSHYHYIPHDRCWTHPLFTPEEGLDPKWQPGATSTHLETLVNLSTDSEKPILTEVPFGESALAFSLRSLGLEVIQVFVIEDAKVIEQRYFEREGKPLPKGVLTRNYNSINRAQENGHFFGTSQQVLEHLKEFAELFLEPIE